MAHKTSSTRLNSTPLRNDREEHQTYESFSPPTSSGKGHKRGAESLDLNEDSPLLSPQRIQDGRGLEDHDTLTGLLDWNDGEGEEESKSLLYLFVLTLSIGG